MWKRYHRKTPKHKNHQSTLRPLPPDSESKEHGASVCVCVRFEVNCHAKTMMKRLSARWKTSAAPFSHALYLFKVTSEKGICIGKRNSECKEPHCRLHAGSWRGVEEKKRSATAWTTDEIFSLCSRNKITCIIISFKINLLKETNHDTFHNGYWSSCSAVYQNRFGLSSWLLKISICGYVFLLQETKGYGTFGKP